MMAIEAEIEKVLYKALGEQKHENQATIKWVYITQNLISDLARLVSREPKACNLHGDSVLYCGQCFYKPMKPEPSREVLVDLFKYYFGWRLSDKETSITTVVSKEHFNSCIDAVLAWSRGESKRERTWCRSDCPHPVLWNQIAECWSGVAPDANFCCYCGNRRPS